MVRFSLKRHSRTLALSSPPSPSPSPTFPTVPLTPPRPRIASNPPQLSYPLEIPGLTFTPASPDPSVNSLADFDRSYGHSYEGDEEENDDEEYYGPPDQGMMGSGVGGGGAGGEMTNMVEFTDPWEFVSGTEAGGAGKDEKGLAAKHKKKPITYIISPPSTPSPTISEKSSFSTTEEGPKLSPSSPSQSSPSAARYRRPSLQHQRLSTSSNAAPPCRPIDLLSDIVYLEGGPLVSSPNGQQKARKRSWLLWRCIAIFLLIAIALGVGIGITEKERQGKRRAGGGAVEGGGFGDGQVGGEASIALGAAPGAMITRNGWSTTVTGSTVTGAGKRKASPTSTLVTSSAVKSGPAGKSAGMTSVNLSDDDDDDSKKKVTKLMNFILVSYKEFAPETNATGAPFNFTAGLRRLLRVPIPFPRNPILNFPSNSFLYDAVPLTMFPTKDVTRTPGSEDIEISKEDRQAGYDTELLKLQPRASQPPPPTTGTPTSPTPTFPSRPLTEAQHYALQVTARDSTTTLLPDGTMTPSTMYSFDVESALLPNAEKDGTIPIGQLYASREAKPKRYRKRRPPKPKWWQRKSCFVWTLVIILFVGAGAGVGVGLFLRHRKSNASSAQLAATPSDAAVDSTTVGPSQPQTFGLVTWSSTASFVAWATTSTSSSTSSSFDSGFWSAASNSEYSDTSSQSSSTKLKDVKFDASDLAFLRLAQEIDSVVGPTERVLAVRSRRCPSDDMIDLASLTRSGKRKWVSRYTGPFSFLKAIEDGVVEGEAGQPGMGVGEQAGGDVEMRDVPARDGNIGLGGLNGKGKGKGKGKEMRTALQSACGLQSSPISDLQWSEVLSSEQQCSASSSKASTSRH
ncbi:hypothetical protein T439DRAFT_366194 [Meredithblackwellia eburnea MCA 4105]